MANHKSAKKRILQDAKKRLANRYYKKSLRTAVKKLRSQESQAEANAFLPKIFSMADKLAKKNVIKANKASNLKKKLNAFAKALGQA